MGHLQTEICMLNVIVTLRGWGGCVHDAKHKLVGYTGVFIRGGGVLQ